MARHTPPSASRSSLGLDRSGGQPLPPDQSSGGQPLPAAQSPGGQPVTPPGSQPLTPS